MASNIINQKVHGDEQFGYVNWISTNNIALVHCIALHRYIRLYYMLVYVPYLLYINYAQKTK